MLDSSTFAAAGAPGVRYASNKVSRAQLGIGLHEVWINDLIRHCGTKALYICDFAHGAGEVMKAAAKCKVGEPASTSNIKVCVWGQDPRKIFAEIGQAVGRTELSNLFMDKKLVVPGHQPIPDPGPLPERTHKFIKALLQKPLRTLSLNSEGYLIIPTQEEIAKACPVTLSDEQEKEIANWRAEFRNEANSSGAGNSQAPRQQEARQGTWTPPMLAPGTQAVSEADMKATFGDEIISQKPMPEGGPGR